MKKVTKKAAPAPKKTKTKKTTAKTKPDVNMVGLSGTETTKTTEPKSMSTAQHYTSLLAFAGAINHKLKEVEAIAETKANVIETNRLDHNLNVLRENFDLTTTEIAKINQSIVENYEPVLDLMEEVGELDRKVDTAIEDLEKKMADFAENLDAKLTYNMNSPAPTQCCGGCEPQKDNNVNPFSNFSGIVQFIKNNRVAQIALAADLVLVATIIVLTVVTFF